MFFLLCRNLSIIYALLFTDNYLHQLRILTFFLSCWLACAVCIGLSVAVIAGIAYGYNYCLAEFIVLTGSDVRVYMRRGQFYDKPDLSFKNSRRGEGEDAFSSDFTDSYHQEVPPGDDSTTAQWERDQDTRKHAEKLTKYSNKFTKNNVVDTAQSGRYYYPDGASGDGVQNQASQKTFDDAGQQDTESNKYHKLTQLPEHRLPIFSRPIISTTIFQSGSSQIVMRKFDPIVIIGPDEVDEYDEKTLKVNLGKETHASVPLEEMERKTVAFTPEMRIRLEDSSTRKLIKMRHWGTSSKPIILEYSTEVDEDNLVYKVV